MSDPLDFTGKSVIVTGGSRGIGLRIAESFVARGATVTTCSRNAPDSLPAGLRFVAADVREPEQIEAVVRAALEAGGAIDIVVNNAGGSPPADAATASPRFHESIIRLNLLAPFHVAQQANAVMQAQVGGGVIVNIASVSGLRPSPGSAAYGAAKAGLINLTQSLAQEWAPKVRVNCVSAGPVRTHDAELHYGGANGIAAVSETIPLARMCEPDDIADACLYLASPLARFVTGANLVLDGGGDRPAFLAAVQDSGQADEGSKRGPY